jgi:isoleucyl-tRNA synthetase
MAPWAPFVADEVWRPLAKGTDLPVSVHLSDWPEAHSIDKKALEDMQKVRDFITEGLAIRATEKLKVRQPLASVTVPEVAEEYRDILAEELNVKAVNFGGKAVKLDTTMTEELKAEGVARDLVRTIQNLRKTSGLNVEDRIVLHVKSADAIVKRALVDFKDVIAAETLATTWADDPQEHAATAKVEGAEVVVSLSKV